MLPCHALEDHRGSRGCSQILSYHTGQPKVSSDHTWKAPHTNSLINKNLITCVIQSSNASSFICSSHGFSDTTCRRFLGRILSSVASHFVFRLLLCVNIVTKVEFLLIKLRISSSNILFLSVLPVSMSIIDIQPQSYFSNPEIMSERKRNQICRRKPKAWLAFLCQGESLVVKYPETKKRWRNYHYHTAGPHFINWRLFCFFSLIERRLIIESIIISTILYTDCY
jgi:hypothetical protein